MKRASVLDALRSPRTLALLLAALGTLLVGSRLLGQLRWYSSSDFEPVDRYSGAWSGPHVEIVVTAQAVNLLHLGIAVALALAALHKNDGIKQMKLLLVSLCGLSLALAAWDSWSLARDWSSNYATDEDSLRAVLWIAWYAFFGALCWSVRNWNSPSAGAGSSPSAGVSSAPPSLEALVRLKSLLDSSALSPDEFEREKQRLLDGNTASRHR